MNPQCPTLLLRLVTVYWVVQCPALLLRLLTDCDPVTFSAPVVNVAPAPALASTPVLSGESCHDELRGATKVPTVRFGRRDEWLHAERVRRVLLQATEEEGRAAGSSTAQPWESVRSG